MRNWIACVNQVAENGDLRFMSSRAQIIDELETTIPNWFRRRNPQWYPKFVHILTVGLPSCLVCRCRLQMLTTIMRALHHTHRKKSCLVYKCRLQMLTIIMKAPHHRHHKTMCL